MAPLGVIGQVVGNLLGQLARWRKDQAARCFGGRVNTSFHQRVDHRQAKGGGFAGPCLRKAHHVAAIHGVRYCLGLYWGWFSNALLFELGYKTGREAQHIKIHYYLSGGHRPAHKGRLAAKCGQACAGCAHILTARATCPDADQALDPLRDVGTGKSIDALHGLYVLLCTRGRMHRLRCKWWIAS